MGWKVGSVLSRHLSSAAANTTAHSPESPLSTKALTTTILNYVHLGRLPKAVSILFSSAIPLPFSLYADLFRICASNKAIIETRKLESHLVTFTPNPPVFLLNRAIESYGKCNCLEDAKELFDEMPTRDGGSWNAMITSFSRNGRAEDALGLFSKMIGEGVFASEVTFASVLGSCGDVLELWLSRQVHGLVVKYGFVGNIILESSLVDVYGKCGVMIDARRMFDEIENPNNVSWNVIVRRYLEMGEGNEAVNMFSKLIRMKVKPMSFTVSNAILACLSFGGLKEGVQIHGFGIKINVEQDEVVSSTLIGMYAKCGDLESARRIFELPSSKNVISYTTMVSGYAVSGRMSEARELFDGMPERTVISWNVMLAGYTRSFEWDKALEFVILMRRKTKDIDHVTLGLILNICAAIPDIELGKQVHGYAYRHGFHFNIFVGNSLLDMYGKCGNLTSARVWFYQMSHLRDRVSWNALLTSYARHGLSEEAMMIFWKMLGETEPSKFTFGTLLAACANIFALELGKQIHAFMIRNGYDIDIVISGALVDMYSKCRSIVYAMRVFNAASSKDVILFNSMILGCSHNGMGEKVVELFETMKKEGIKPDHNTFRSVLRACICEGRVKLGRQYFELMSDKYCLLPHLEHYDSMIELYGQYGFMDELELFLKNMPFKPTAAMLTKVFDFSRKYKCFKLGEWASDRLNELNPLPELVAVFGISASWAVEKLEVVASKTTLQQREADIAPVGSGQASFLLHFRGRVCDIFISAAKGLPLVGRILLLGFSHANRCCLGYKIEGFSIYRMLADCKRLHIFFCSKELRAVDADKMASFTELQPSRVQDVGEVVNTWTFRCQIQEKERKRKIQLFLFPLYSFLINEENSTGQFLVALLDFQLWNFLYFYLIKFWRLYYMKKLELHG